MALASAELELEAYKPMRPTTIKTLIGLSHTLHYAALVLRATGRSGWLEMETLGDTILRDYCELRLSEEARSYAWQEAMRLLSFWEQTLTTDDEMPH